jgi:hypothetical protein
MYNLNQIVDNNKYVYLHMLGQIYQLLNMHAYQFLQIPNIAISKTLYYLHKYVHTYIYTYV